MSRVKRHTPKAMEAYEERVKTYYDKLSPLWNRLLSIIETNINVFNQEELQFHEQSLKFILEQTNSAEKEFQEYLTRTCSIESNLESISLGRNTSDVQSKVGSHLEQLLARKTQFEPAASNCENMSLRSSSSKASKASSRSHAKAEAAKAKIAFIQKEAELRRQHAEFEERQLIAQATAARQKANIETDLMLLQQEKETAALIAEAETYSRLSDKSSPSPTVRHTPVSDSKERVQDFLNNQALVFQSTQLTQNLPIDPLMQQFEDRTTNQHKSERQTVTSVPPAGYAFMDTFRQTSAQPKFEQQHVVVSPDEHPVMDTVQQTSAHPNLNQQPQFQHYPCPPTNSFVPLYRPQFNDQSVPQPTMYPLSLLVQPNPYLEQPYDQITKFLLRKDLAMSRLSYFDDKPETFPAWKGSFRTVCTEMGVSPSGECDLLIKWLGPESRRFAISIRSAFARTPATALDRIWERLEDRYGTIENVHRSILQNINRFPKNNNNESIRLYELSDMLAQLESLKEDPKFTAALSYFDSSVGVGPIVSKLPYNLQEKWVSTASAYKSKQNVVFPPFSEFSKFIERQAKIKNDPGLFTAATEHLKSSSLGEAKFKTQNKTSVRARKTDIDDSSQLCTLHKTNTHSLETCRSFKSKSFADKKQFIKDQKLCFKCFKDNHQSKDCKKDIKCDICQKPHNTLLHIEKQEQSGKSNAGEGFKLDKKEVGNMCTKICKQQFGGKSCAKTILVKVYRKDCPEEAKKVYAIIDDQSNRTLANHDFFELFRIQGTEIEYSLSSCSGTHVTSGRTAEGLIIEPMDGSSRLDLPSVLECNEIPNTREEIPTPEIARSFPHLQDIAREMSPLSGDSQICLLIGRDLPEAHHVYDQRTGDAGCPYAQKLSLGWVIVGETCLDKVHRPNVDVKKTFILRDGRPTLFEPCSSDMFVFERTPQDNKIGLSREDHKFIEVMDQEVFRDKAGFWTAPLPFKPNRPRLPNNREQALKRAHILDKNLQRNPTKKSHFVEFMTTIIEDGNAEIAPDCAPGEERWYLPIFGVYHPQKPNKIRGVFDSSAQYKGLSLNSVLLQGPDLTNSLLGVLMRFRENSVAIAGDIQHMFYCFKVAKHHRNYLRFMWYRDNDPDKDLIEYRMTVHVFGNSPSPSVANYASKEIARRSEEKYGKDVRRFIERDFYVDDGLVTTSTSSEAVSLMKRTQEALRVIGNVRLHKIVSNSLEVVSAFPSEDLANGMPETISGKAQLPVQSCLGLVWDLNSDLFTFSEGHRSEPKTKRDILSVVNGIYDPLGFLAPFTIQGKVLLRDVNAKTANWDEPIPDSELRSFNEWNSTLCDLKKVKVKRPYTSIRASNVIRRELTVYSDASEKAIAAVVYIKTIKCDQTYDVGFVLGKSKVAPTHGHTIPRLELCGAVLAVQLCEIARDELDIEIDSVMFFTDSKVVLGYIKNQCRRFYVYVSNRVDRILQSTEPSQWHYVSTHLNPADCATRSVPLSEISECPWLKGPPKLATICDQSAEHYLVDPENDVEIRPQVNTMTTKLTLEAPVTFGCHRFERFSDWQTLIRAISVLQHVCQSRHRDAGCNGWHVCTESTSVHQTAKARNFIIRTVQRDHYQCEIENLQSHKPLSKNSPIRTLNPFLDENGVLRVGGRLNHSVLPQEQTNPVIIPGRSHIASLLVRYYHIEVKHQGRHFTEGAIRSNGFWITGGKRLVTSSIYNCVTCRKLRGKFQTQIMADLPENRLTPAAPFTYVGVDTFGPSSIVARKTRSGQANHKRWAILFTCLVTRAIHIEIVEEMSSSAFINALRRFTSFRGPVKEFRSDRGTNFIGSISDLEINAINVEEDPVKGLLREKGTSWIFNPPHASHFGGVWERMIGIVRRILDALIIDHGHKTLTHDVLTTFMAEVCNIVNSRPIVPVSTDAEAPEILSPNILLTQKCDHTADFYQFDLKDIYRAEWKRVQTLAELFWKRWREEYLHTLQTRRKWTKQCPDIKQGDVVLLKDSDVCRNYWPVGVVDQTFPSDDGKVRKLSVRIRKDGHSVTYTRPISEIVLLVDGQ